MVMSFTLLHLIDIFIKHINMCIDCLLNHIINSIGPFLYNLFAIFDKDIDVNILIFFLKKYVCSSNTKSKRDDKPTRREEKRLAFELRIN
jgi:hypothetical protein